MKMLENRCEAMLMPSSCHGSSKIAKQAIGGGRSSILTSQVEFTPSDNECSTTAQFLQNKYYQLGKAGKNEPVSNGVNNTASTSSHSKSLPTMNGNHQRASTTDDIPAPKLQLSSPNDICLKWEKMYSIGAGLINLGNTCFMNTVIQCLTYCPPLVNYLLLHNDHSEHCKIVNNFCMMCELMKHIKRAFDRSGEAIKPAYIHQKLRCIAKHFQFGRQEDAHEFLRYVIDNLWKACLANYEMNGKIDPLSKETTVVNHIFGGYHRSQVTCLRCREKSNTYDHFMDFILDIKNAASLEKALEKFIEPEVLQNENAYKCPKCKMKVPAEKRFTVHRPPNIATFQLKRFDYNKMFGGKITKHVAYPETFNLRHFMSESKGPPVTYKLNAVLVHMGPSCNSGHYFCFVRNSNGVWYCMDDAKVHQVRLHDVLNQQAYVLFYMRLPQQNNNNNNNNILKPQVATPNLFKPEKPSIPPKEERPVARPLPTMIIKQPSHAVASSTSSPVQNGSAFSVASRPPLSSLPKVQETGYVHQNSPNTSRTTIGAPKNVCVKTPSTLVPYVHSDSSNSSDTELGEFVSVFQQKSRNDKLPGSPKKSTPDAVDVGCSPSKINATSQWQVVDSNRQSPSIASAASGSSTNSVNSTADWTVHDHERDRYKLSNKESLVRKFRRTKQPPASPDTKKEEPSKDDHTATSLTTVPKILSPNERLLNNTDLTSICVDSIESNVTCSDRVSLTELKNFNVKSESKMMIIENGSGDSKELGNHEPCLSNFAGDVSKNIDKGSSDWQVHKIDGNLKTVTKPHVPEVKHSPVEKYSKDQKHNDKLVESSREDSQKLKSSRDSSSSSSSSSDSSSDSDSSSSKSYEWVEKTKETLDAEKNAQPQRKPFVKEWNSELKNGYRNGRLNHSFPQDNEHRMKIKEELTKYNSYSDKVSPWDGRRNYIDRDHYRENYDRKRHYRDDYDDDYDQGKTKKVRRPHYQQHFHHNNFQRAYDNNRRGHSNSYYNHHHYRQEDHHRGWKKWDKYKRWK